MSRAAVRLRRRRIALGALSVGVALGVTDALPAAPPAAVMSGKLTGVRPAAGSGASAGAPRFKYSYKVLSFRVEGSFDATYDSGDGRTFAGLEFMRYWGAPSYRSCHSPHCHTFKKGTLTLQSPPSKQVGINGLLQISPFLREFTITGKETVDTGEGVQIFDCSGDFSDKEGFSGLMRLQGSTVLVYWTLFGVPFNCEPFGGQVSVDYYDRTSTESSDAQFTDSYPLSAFRKRRVHLPVYIDHSWLLNDGTKAHVHWSGNVNLERVARRAGMR